MKKIQQVFTSSIGRAFAYLTTFILVSALHELLVRLLNPALWSNGSLLLTLSTLGIFVAVGAVFANQQTTLSRVTSATTLLILGLIGLRIGHSVVPDLYLFVVALCVAVVGAQSVLHHTLTNLKQTVLCSLLIVLVSIIIAVAFAYGMTVLDRVAAQYL